MKTLKLRVWSLGLVLLSLLFTVGCHEDRAKADAPVFPAPLIGEADKEAPPPPLVDATLAAEGPAAPVPGTNAPVNPPRIVQDATVPSNLKTSPAMAEIIKLVQAGVSEEVILSYITNSTHAFNADSDSIVYLNDLGVSTSVVTAIIQHDSSPEIQAKRAGAAQSLPPGVALTTPATNVYPPVTASAPIPSYSGPPAPADNSGALPPAVETAPPATESVNVNYFYDSLAPYGSWVDVEGYGLCWRPTVAVVDPYWRPYCQAGRWTWSDAGWYWYSDYSWGWAPFHYGRWCSYPRVGWLWVPDTCWGPSWVTWRYSPSYCGWAPLPPGCTYSGFGLSYYSRHVGISFDFGLGSHCFTYVPVNRFCDWHPSRHILPITLVNNIHNKTTIINNYSGRDRNIINKGPDVDTIGKAVRTKIPKVRIRDEGVVVARNNVTAKPERIETVGSSISVVRPQLPKNPPSITARATRPGGARVEPVSASAAGSPLVSKLAPAKSGAEATTARPKTIGGRFDGVPVVKTEPNATPRANPRDRQDTVIISRPNPVSPPFITGNNTPQKNDIATAARGNEHRNNNKTETRNSGDAGAVARITPLPSPVSPAETPRSENRSRSENILVRPFNQSANANQPVTPRAQPSARSNQPILGRGNDTPLRSYAEPSVAPRSITPPLASPRVVAPAPSVSRPSAPAPRVDIVRPQAPPSGGFGGAVAVPRSAPAPSVSAPAPSARPSAAPSGGGGGGGRSGGGNGGGGGGGGGGKGGRGRD